MANNQIVQTVDELSKAEGVAAALVAFMEFAKDPKKFTAASTELKDAQDKIKAGKDAEASITKLEQTQKDVDSKIALLESAQAGINAEKASIKASLEDITAREKAIAPAEKEIKAFEAEKEKFETYKKNTLVTIQKKQDALDEREQESANDKKEVKRLTEENATLNSKIDSLRGHLE